MQWLVGYVGCNDWPDRCLNAIELTVLCAFVCRLGYFDPQMGEFLLYKIEGLTYLSLWKNVTNYIHEKKSCDNLHSSIFPLLHLWILLHKLQTTLFDWINLFSSFSIYLPYMRRFYFICGFINICMLDAQCIMMNREIHIGEGQGQTPWNTHSLGVSASTGRAYKWLWGHET
jgi:hypothetical protein